MEEKNKYGFYPSDISQTEIILKKNLKRLREGKNITRYKLATELEFSKQNYNRYENLEYHSEIRYKVLEKLADFYNVEVYELFKSENN